MKLSVRTTHTVTTDDIDVYCDPPLIFEAVGNIDPQTQTRLADWHKANYPPEQAVAFIPKLFISVSQNGEVYPLTTEADAQALREAVGDTFLSDLVERFWTYELNFFKKKRNGSVNLLSASENGTPPAA